MLDILYIVVFYPYWYDLLKLPTEEITQMITILEKEMSEMKLNYYQNQKKNGSFQSWLIGVVFYGTIYLYYFFGGI